MTATRTQLYGRPGDLSLAGAWNQVVECGNEWSEEAFEIKVLLPRSGTNVGSPFPIGWAMAWFASAVLIALIIIFFLSALFNARQEAVEEVASSHSPSAFA